MSKMIIRRCLGCGERVDRAHLVRMVVGEEGRVGFASRKMPRCRSAYLHARRECAQPAIREKTLRRAFRREIHAPVLSSFLVDLGAHIDAQGGPGSDA